MSAGPGARACPACGYTNFGRQDACLHCGTALPAMDPWAAVGGDTSVACASCGAAMGASDAFCTRCGARRS